MYTYTGGMSNTRSVNPARARNRRRSSGIINSNLIYAIKIKLQGISPPIFRRLLVKENTSLKKLHRIFQVAMGWKNCHLHSFEVGGITYGPIDPEWPEDTMEDEEGILLRDIAPVVGATFVYEYDFGDCWDHLVQVENIMEPTPGITVPCCVTGSRSCPPEDVGSTEGYEEFLEAIADPTHKKHEWMLEWVGRPFDPEFFDAESVNRALRRMR